MLKKYSVFLSIVLVVALLCSVSLPAAAAEGAHVTFTEPISTEEILEIPDAAETEPQQEADIVILVRLTAESRRSAVKQAIAGLFQAAGHSAPQYRFEYTMIFPGFSLTAPPSLLEDIAALEGVECAEEAVAYEVQADVDGEAVTSLSDAQKISAVNLSNARTMGMEGWATDPDAPHGEGLLVAVVDSGTYIDHAVYGNYDVTAFEGLSREEMEKTVSRANLLANRIYKTATGKALSSDDYYLRDGKIAFCFNYGVDGKLETDYTDVSAKSIWHGLTTSATLAGYDRDAGYYGVAPYAQLVFMKISTENPNKPGVYKMYGDITYAALEDCCRLDVDVVNLSFGTTAGYSVDGSIQSAVIQALADRGISVVASAGNEADAAYQAQAGLESKGNGAALFTSENNRVYPKAENPDYGTVGSPSSYVDALSVAACTRDDYVYSLTLNAGGKTTVFHTVLQQQNVAKPMTGSYRYVFCEDFSEEALNAMTLQGKLVVSTKASEEIGEALAARGAVGLLTTEQVTYVEALSRITIYEDTYMVLKANPTASVTFQSGLAMPYFTSVGVTSDLRLKPELTAPGTLIAVAGEYTSRSDGYSLVNGTSYSAPNVAGAMTLLRQTLKGTGLSKTEEYERAANLLISTAKPITADNGVPYSPRRQGAGLISIEDAVSTPAYLSTAVEDEQDTSRPILNLFDDANGTYPFTFYVTNTSEKSVSYGITLDVLMPQVKADAEGVLRYTDYDEYVEKNKNLNKTVTVKPGETKKVTFSYSIPYLTKAKMKKQFENGCYLEGYVKLTNKKDKTNVLSAPFLGFYGDWTKAPVFDSDSYDAGALDSDYYLKNSIEEALTVSGSMFPCKTYGSTAYSTVSGGTVRLGSNYAAEVQNLKYKQLYLEKYNALRGEGDGNARADAQAYMAQAHPELTYYEYTMRSDHIAVSPNGDGRFDTVTGITPVLLRTPCYITTFIADETGTLAGSGLTYPRKTVSDDNTSYCNLFYFSENYFKKYIRPVNNKSYTVSCRAGLNYSDLPGLRMAYTWSFPVAVDIQAPQIENLKLTQSGGKTVLTADVSDNHYLSAIGFCIGTYNQETHAFHKGDLYYQYYFADEKQVHLEYDITDNLQMPTGENEVLSYYLCCQDYAMNESETQEILTALPYKTTATLNAGKTLSLAALLPTAAEDFRSSDSAVAKVDPTGVLTGVKAGTATVTATLADGRTAEIAVTVKATVVSEPQSISVKRGKTADITSLRKISGKVVSWSSTNRAIAYASGTGKVYALGAGKVTITACYADGSKESFQISVTK